VEPLLPDGISGTYTFATSIQQVTPAFAVVNITRVDADSGWTFGLKLQYYAFTTPYMKTHPYD
jgi:hypothetical protein